MAKFLTKKSLRWIIPVAVVLLGVVGYRIWKSRKEALPDGIVAGNGRLEAKLVDIAAREPLRVLEVLVDEGAIVKPGQVLVKMDTQTLEASLAEANAAIATATERLAVARASIAKQKSEIDLAKVEAARSENLVKEGAGSQRELDTRKTKVETTTATLSEAEAMMGSATQMLEEAKASAEVVRTRINDATLKSPVTGRVLYRLAEAGEVLAAGGKALTLVNLEDVYMEIFLPSEQAAAVRIGSEGRIMVDYDPQHSIAGKVTFVSPEAQFTPKQVETRSERELLMFRVKIQVPKEVASQFIERLKTGVRGMGYVKVREDAQWPKKLQQLIEPRPIAQRQTPMEP